MKDQFKNLLTNFALSLGLIGALGMVVVVAFILGAICSLVFGGETWLWAVGIGVLDIVLLAIIARQFMNEVAEGLTGDGDRRTPMQ